MTDLDAKIGGNARAVYAVSVRARIIGGWGGEHGVDGVGDGGREVDEGGAAIDDHLDLGGVGWRSEGIEGGVCVSRERFVSETRDLCSPKQRIGKCK